MPIDVYDIPGACGDHVVQSYEHDADLVRAVSDYLLQGIESGEAAVVVATDAHRRSLEHAFGAAGFDVPELCARRALRIFDAVATLALFHCDGRIDRGLFQDALGGVLREAAGPGRPVRAYGEMVALLWDAGHVPAAIELEELWNDLRRQIPFALFCGYPSQSVSGPDHSQAWGEVCRLHSGVRRQFAATINAPRVARLFVAEALGSQGLGWEVVEDAALVAGELAANAFVHARSPFTVAVSSVPGAVRIAVHDASAELPTPRHAEPMAQSGRGLGLVAAVSGSWGMERTPDGKVVWAEVAL